MAKEYGRFNNDGWEYIISTPHTPRLWYNYIGNSRYALRVAQNCIGNSIYDPPGGNRITSEDAGKFVYVKDLDTRNIWSLTYEPVKAAFDLYECWHSAGYTKFITEIYGIHSEMLVYIPIDQDMECWKITIKNNSTGTKNLEIFPYVEWQLSGYTIPWDDYKNYSHCYFNQEDALIMGIVDDPLYPWKRHYGFMASSIQPVGWECSKKQFIGNGDLCRPGAVECSACSGKEAGTEACISAMQLKIQLAPDEEREFTIAIAYSCNKKEYGSQVKEFISANDHNNELEKLQSYWRSKFETVHIESPDKHMDRLMNIWLKHQINQANLWCRGGSCRGYRDVLQDSLGIVSFDKETSRRQIKTALSHQYSDGFAPRQFSETGAPYDVRLYADSPVWIPITLAAYVKETGDFDFLNEKLPYITKGIYSYDLQHAMNQVTEFMTDCQDMGGSVFEHAIKAMDFMWEHRGQHGLSLIYGGDWNDPLNNAGRKGRGESVWLSMALVYALKEMSGLCRQLNRSDKADELMKHSDELSSAINKHAWDGRWYVRAFDDDGNPIGTNNDQYGKIFIMSQSWSVISGVADKDRTASAMQAVREYLGTPYGFMTMSPAYPSYDERVGRISVLRPGTYENAAIYCHASTWNMMAELISGNADHAYDAYLKMNPYNPEHPPAESFSEPYVFPNCYFGKDAGDRYGQSVMGWLTATADWIYKVLLEWMIGVRSDYHKLIIAPQLPSAWNSARVIKKIRGCTYTIDIQRDESLTNGNTLVTCDDSICTDGIPYFSDMMKDHKVKVLFNNSASRSL